MCRRRFTTAVWCVAISLGFQSFVLAVSIRPLVALEPQAAGAYSHAAAISADGTVVVGDSRNSRGIIDPVKWTTGGGVVNLGNPSGSSSYATGVGIKDNGELVIGGNIGGIARRWDSATGLWRALPPTSRCGTSQANSVRILAGGEEALIAGWVDVRAGCGAHLFNGGYLYDWSSGAYTATYEQSSSQCDFWAVAADGTAVGRQIVSEQGDRAVYWTGSGPPQTIAPLSGVTSQARAISVDGSTIVGYAVQGGLSRAFMWKPGEAAYVDLGTLVGDNQSLAMTVSGDGSVAGGSSTSSARPSQTSSMATIWDSQGPRSLHDILSSGGADLTGWVALNNVQSISADGRTVCGNGWFDADGSGSGAATQMGFVAQIPEPSTSLLVGGLMLSLLMVRQGSFKPLPAISDRSRKP